MTTLKLSVPEVLTATDTAYVRLHGYRGLYVGSYPRAALVRWARRLRQMESEAGTVYVYFNNDTDAAAPRDAARLEGLLVA